MSRATHLFVSHASARDTLSVKSSAGNSRSIPPFSFSQLVMGKAVDIPVGDQELLFMQPQVAADCPIKVRLRHTGECDLIVQHNGLFRRLHPGERREEFVIVGSDTLIVRTELLREPETNALVRTPV